MADSGGRDWWPGWINPGYIDTWLDLWDTNRPCTGALCPGAPGRPDQGATVFSQRQMGRLKRRPAYTASWTPVS
jgi:hypothetical protein